MYKGEDFFIVEKWTSNLGGRNDQGFHILGIVDSKTVHVHVNSPTEVHFYEKTDENNESIKTVIAFAKMFLAGKINWREKVKIDE